MHPLSSRQRIYPQLALPPPWRVFLCSSPSPLRTSQHSRPPPPPSQIPSLLPQLQIRSLPRHRPVTRFLLVLVNFNLPCQLIQSTSALQSLTPLRLRILFTLALVRLSCAPAPTPPTAARLPQVTGWLSEAGASQLVTIGGGGRRRHDFVDQTTHRRDRGRNRDATDPLVQPRHSMGPHGRTSCARCSSYFRLLPKPPNPIMAARAGSIASASAPRVGGWADNQPTVSDLVPCTAQYMAERRTETNHLEPGCARRAPPPSPSFVPAAPASNHPTKRQYS